MEQMRERVARIIDPSTWAVLDSYLADAKRKYAKSSAGYDPEAFKDRRSLVKATEIEALMQPEIDRRVAEERAKQQTIADALWNAETALSVFEDQLYDRLGGDAVEPFSHIGHDHYDRSIEIYDLCKSVTLSDDDRAFIHAAGFATIYTDRKGDPDLSVKMRRKERAKLLERLREPSEAMVSAGYLSIYDTSGDTKPEEVWQAMLAQYEKEVGDA